MKKKAAHPHKKEHMHKEEKHHEMKHHKSAHKAKVATAGHKKKHHAHDE